jgi:hypothetical protein
MVAAGSKVSAAAVAAVMAQNTCFSQNTWPATMG